MTQNIKKTLAAPCERSKIVSFLSSRMKNIVAARSKFPVKLICWIALGSASRAYCFLKSTGIIL